MRKSLLFVCAFTLAIFAAFGCKRKNADFDARLRGLEAENAALRAQLAQPQAAPERDPSRLSADTRAKLEGEGIKVKQTADSVVLTLPSAILFDSGSASLKAAAKRALDQSASVLKGDLVNARVIVEGHTDNVPISRTKHLWKDNQALSVARAKAVAAHLQNAGVDGSLISIVGQGETKPVAPNNTAQGRSMNRRVEIIVKL
jgi:chemotaxis protein MotB